MTKTSKLKKETLVTAVDALNEAGFTTFTETEKLPGKVLEQILAKVDLDALLKAVADRWSELADPVAWVDDRLDYEDVKRLASLNDLELVEDYTDGTLDARDPLIRLVVELVDAAAYPFRVVGLIGKLRQELRGRNVYGMASLNQRELI